MKLSARLADDFPRKTQEKGRVYFSSGAVRITEGSATAVRGRVRGSDNYQTSLSLADDLLVGWCTCPYVDQNLTPCKHLWALLLAAERAGHLSAAERVRDLALELEEPGADNADAFDDEEEVPHWTPRPAAWAYDPPPRPGTSAPWKQQLARLRQEVETEEQRSPAWPADRTLLYVVDVPLSVQTNKLVVDIAHQKRKQNGEWGVPKFEAVGRRQVPTLPDPDDRDILTHLYGADGSVYDSYGYYGSPLRFALGPPLGADLLARMSRTGRLRLRPGTDTQAKEIRPLAWDDGPPWAFWLNVQRNDAGKSYLVSGTLRRGEEWLPLSKPLLLAPGGFVVWDDRVARFDDGGAVPWIGVLRRESSIRVPLGKKDELLEELAQFPQLPRVNLPDELRYEEVALPPRPRLTVRTAKQGYGQPRLEGDLTFEYGGLVVPAHDKRRGVFEAEARRLVLRDRPAEQAAAAELARHGFRPYTYYGRDPFYEVAPRRLPGAVRDLLARGWHVEAEGKVYRPAGKLNIAVRSGVDWFDLEGSADFGGQEVPLPRLLQALQGGNNMVALDDGTMGLVPEEWLQKYGLLGGLGEAQGDALRFTRAQVGLLDALLAAQPDVSFDDTFRQARDLLRTFEGIEPVDPPSAFTGELRGYQRDGLGWLRFLEKFGFGGCLADDMGLGKTVQVLAHLAGRRAADPAVGPTLAVVPRSLVYNWKGEAERFAPGLRVLDHTGAGRVKDVEHLQGFDLVLTTYGTLRRDALLFKDVTFDYCILDEAQAIKNADSESAKAARLLHGRHRLALSGTPVENHLGELWSLFQFLNPGMLGPASRSRLGGAAARNPDPETRSLLARGLKPFILRRTKEQVARDLPEKTEQTMFCDLEPAQRRLYDELRDHYRQSLLTRIAEVGLKRAKIQVLEALLRLRQAACHPGLVDKNRTAEPSAKLDLLLPHLQEASAEGHKTLVFSQFTSLLSIVRDRLDTAGLPYEYLDGRTRDRAARVERFQNDPDCRLFLVSLKAGGVGLNLTAAEYVFLLDPWWNPAVEAQAIDRAHRIGQTRPVFAYRLIARDTVEEKVLTLQQSKRELADAILNADNRLITDLQREDLELLLS